MIEEEKSQTQTEKTQQSTHQEETVCECAKLPYTTIGHLVKTEVEIHLVVEEPLHT